MLFFHLYTEDEFEGIAREHLPMFYRMALRILKNDADAEDAVQTALLRGWNRRLILRTPEKLVGWLARIVVNESYTIIRRRARRATVPLDSVPETRVEQNCAGCGSDEQALKEKRLQRLEAAVAALPELYRQAVQWTLLDGLETGEAARLLGCSVNTLYQRIHKAKQMLREALKDE